MSEKRRGRVVRVDAKVCHVEVDGEVIQAAPRGSLFEELKGAKNPIAVGDFVLLSFDGDPVGIDEVLERKNYLGRTASSHDPREQVLVANVDQLMLVSSLRKPGFSSNRTDRILAACTWYEIPAVLVLNKVDLVKDSDEIDAVRETYEAVGVDVVQTCAKDGRGVAELAERLKDKVTALYGPSGAGKSTLINSIQPGLNLKEGKISKYWKQGKHTTTFSTLHPLDMGGYVIDTPGIRAFRLYDVKRTVLRDLFPEFEPYHKHCRYLDCTHDHEPDCAVFAAVDAEEIPASRFASYLDLLEELAPETALDDGIVEPDPEE